ncbi:hypothetical protein LTR85_000649 [Meristemomyces frigidus]|nr:hypothetical protein LTR85_000649 [Meristemomyces frigidus]
MGAGNSVPDASGLMTDEELALSIYHQEVQDRQSATADAWREREDANAFSSWREGKQHADGVSDEELARSIYEQEVADYALAEQIANGSAGYVTAADTESQIRRDEELALQLTFGDNVVHTSEVDDDERDIEQVVANASLQDMQEQRPTHAESSSRAESSAQGAARATTTKTLKRKAAACVSCLESVPADELAGAPCGHDYCSGCVTQLFTNAMADEAAFPPRCCRQHLDLDAMRPYLDAATARAFQQKAVELSTQDRTYCHQQQCSTFIPPATIHGDVADCPSCQSRTCTMCKAASHTGDCPQDTGLQQVMETAQREGWRRCVCRRMIELNQGCNHMT